ncbi:MULTISPECIES: hypothetical protein [Paracoccus]|uniref:hypothetical protein n=1 Tax=Paracoccus TaxID=265 RepID=UPI001FB70767|nr:MULTISPECIES: hypothetical protein [Paracoccus]MCJ1902901.1 hypothetical protein [Paracoccus versutus]MDF3907421.1 hypothetical protein [Paracoccus sp. AS002]
MLRFEATVKMRTVPRHQGIPPLDAPFPGLHGVNLTLATVIFGTVHDAFELGVTDVEGDALRQQLLAMCQANLQIGGHSGP